MERSKLEKIILEKNHHSQVSALHESILPLQKYSRGLLSSGVDKESLRVFLREAVDMIVEGKPLLGALFSISLPMELEDKIIEEEIYRIINLQKRDFNETTD